MTREQAAEGRRPAVRVDSLPDGARFEEPVTTVVPGSDPARWREVGWRKGTKIFSNPSRARVQLDGEEPTNYPCSVMVYPLDEAPVKVTEAGRASTKRGSGAYLLPPKIVKGHPLHEHTALKGQQRLVADWFRHHPEGGTAEEVTRDLVSEGFKCNQEPLRAVYYYLNEWKKKGWLTQQ